jgi:hypothetical protein
MAGKIFINYRRGDDPGNTGRLFDRLQEVFEPQQLFLDVDNIPPGLDFVRVINERVAEADVVLAVIGKDWINARNADGTRRLDDPKDFVRIELASALNQDKRVIPVLVGEAAMPQPEQLPEVLRPLATRHAVRLTHERFRADAQGLIKALQQSLEEIEKRRKAEALRRKEFEQRASKAKTRIRDRTTDAEKKLNACREEFESQIAELRAGRDFMPPDPLEAIDDNIAALSNQIEILERHVHDERSRADQAEASAAGASAEVVALKDQLGKVSASAAMLDARNAAIEQLNSDLAKRDAQIASHESAIASQATELATLAEAAANTRQALEAKDAWISELGDMITSHKRRQDGETQRLMMWSGAAAVAAACVFTIIGWSIAPSGSTQPSATVQTLNARIASLSAENKTLQTQADTAQRQASDATNENKSASSQVAALNSQIDTLKGQNQALLAQADDTTSKNKTALAALNSQIDTLKGQNQALLAQANDTAGKNKTALAALNSQIDTLKGQNQALLAQADDTASKNKTALAALNSQIDTLKGQNQALQAQANDTATKNNVATAALKTQIDNLTGLKQAQETRIGDLQSRVADLQNANALFTPVARCDALAGYSSDPDRPSSNGWTSAIKDARVAWTTCRDALPTSVGDPKTHRRIILQMARAYQASGDLKNALQYWQDAAKEGSSRAFSELASFYGDRNNRPYFDANQAWEYLKSAADIDPADPAALYLVALANLFPDSAAKFVAPSPNTKDGESYLQRAINADYGPAYYLAGARYWRKSKTERTKDEQTRDITIATWYLTISWCTKKHSDKEGNDARKFLNAADLTCQ